MNRPSKKRITSDGGHQLAPASPVLARENDPEMAQAKAQYLAAYPSCRLCGGKATSVSLRDEAPERRFDRTNFEALCNPCQKGREQNEEKD